LDVVERRSVERVEVMGIMRITRFVPVLDFSLLPPISLELFRD